jgi:hypothetical protein
MKYLLIVIMTFASCSSMPVEPRIKHIDRRYRTCSEKEVKNYEKFVCFRYCYKKWFTRYCDVVIKDRTSPEFEDFVFIHSSKI